MGYSSPGSGVEMKFPNTVLVAARVACLAGGIAAGFATPSIAGPALSEPETAARQASGAPGLQELNLSGLEQRVRDTRAISVFQKLALHQEIDDLLARFRRAHSGGSSGGKGEFAALRRPYERLLANIQSLLGRDPQLANEISVSREAIWEVLTDHSKFASL